MARELNQRELRNQSGEVMRALERGESFIVTRNGTPVGELRPLGRRNYIKTDELIELLKGSGPMDYEEFRADLDRVVDPAFEPRG